MDLGAPFWSCIEKQPKLLGEIRYRHGVQILRSDTLQDLSLGHTGRHVVHQQLRLFNSGLTDPELGLLVHCLAQGGRCGHVIRVNQDPAVFNVPDLLDLQSAVFNLSQRNFLTAKLACFSVPSKTSERQYRWVAAKADPLFLVRSAVPRSLMNPYCALLRNSDSKKNRCSLLLILTKFCDN